MKDTRAGGQPINWIDGWAVKFSKVGIVKTKARQNGLGMGSQMDRDIRIDAGVGSQMNIVTGSQMEWVKDYQIERGKRNQVNEKRGIVKCIQRSQMNGIIIISNM